MNITNRILRSVSNKSGDVFLRTDFKAFGSPAQISRALNVLQSNGRLVKLGMGIYARAMPSILSGKPIPVKPLEVLAPQALRKLGVTVDASRLTKAYNSGQSTQITAGVVINTGKRRIVRRLGFNGIQVQYERA